LPDPEYLPAVSIVEPSKGLPNDIRLVLGGLAILKFIH
jgi:hypothetical protein